ncbi:hypothetical protein HMPREF1619_04252 [Klebsiella pneumoniae 909957]|nr:hypothetical protein KP13_01831 [Klebsiella pneumoniae subsp. pneumoniae Kp13]AVK30365.1 hypothetical protein CSB98_0035 [Klebsiella pneumoniae]AWF05394.1 hypothetical protein CSC25_4580 [Klebsiella pneumoniae]ESA99181.1 hypothetical protein HMPREF1619_04252 [Klebsiella pneumoniae 909957]
MFRAYRIALKCDILNQHFTSCARNKMGKSMFFNNIKNGALPAGQRSGIIRG